MHTHTNTFWLLKSLLLCVCVCVCVCDDVISQRSHAGKVIMLWVVI